MQLQHTLDLLAKYKANIKPTINKFQEAEQTGRDLFQTWCLKNKMIARFNQDEVGCFDAWTGTGDNIMYEIKTKPCPFESMRRLIENEGLMFEEKKFLALREIWLKDKTKEFYYWMAFTDKIAVHQINFDKVYKIRYYDCPKTTVGDNTMVSKKIYLIEHKDLSISKRD